LSTGDKYAGSSSALARRLIGYFNGTHKNTGKLIPLIKSEGVGALKFQVIPLIWILCCKSRTKSGAILLVTFWV
jgi:hypothetical protein